MKVCYSWILGVSRSSSVSEAQRLGIENQCQHFQAIAHPVAIKKFIIFAPHPVKGRLINGKHLMVVAIFLRAPALTAISETLREGSIRQSMLKSLFTTDFYKTEQITLNFSCLSAKWGHWRLVRNEKSQYSDCGHVSKKLLWSSRISFRMIGLSYFSQICQIHHSSLVSWNKY